MIINELKIKYYAAQKHMGHLDRAKFKICLALAEFLTNPNSNDCKTIRLFYFRSASANEPMRNSSNGHDLMKNRSSAIASHQKL